MIQQNDPNSLSSLTNFSDYTNKDYASIREAMLSLAKERLPEWTDHSPNDLGILLLELFAEMSDMMLYYQDRLAEESYLETAVERRSIVNLLRLIGYELRPHQSSTADLTLLFDFDAQGTIELNNGTEFQTTAEATGEPINFQYLQSQELPPLRIDLESLEEFIHSDGNSYRRFSGLRVKQVDATIVTEIVGSSNGNPSQRFPLRRSPIIEDQLEVVVFEGSLTDEGSIWSPREILLDSLSSDRHYTIRRDDDSLVYIEFGDGRHGKIPLRGRNNIHASYRVGGGIKGNVPAFTISKAVTSIPHLKTVFNELPATGGANPESSETATERGPRLFRSMGRAVTAEDYEAHALEFGLAKAHARSLGWHHIEIYVAPIGGGQPTDTLKEDLRNYFEDKRMMSTIVDIKDPVYVNVCMKGTMEIDAYQFTEQVQQKVANAIAELLAFDKVDFQFRLYLSKVYEAIEDIEGITSVFVTSLNVRTTNLNAGESNLPENGLLQFGWNEIPIVLPMTWTQSASDNSWIWEITC